MSEAKPIPPKSKGSPSAEVIQAYWEKEDEPSSPSVGAKLRIDGYDISDSTVLRCWQKGFAPRPTYTKGGKRSAAVNAVKRVQAVAPGDASPELVASAVVECIRSLPEGERDRLKELLGMDDAELEKQKGKLVKVAGLLLAEGVCKRPDMMLLMPDKTAKLMVVLDTPAPTVPPIAPTNGDDAKIIEHVPTELTPAQIAIRNFRMMQSRSPA